VVVGVKTAKHKGGDYHYGITSELTDMGKNVLKNNKKKIKLSTFLFVFHYYQHFQKQHTLNYYQHHQKTTYIQNKTMNETFVLHLLWFEKSVQAFRQEHNHSQI
jgi:hypothetical protein